MVKLFVKSISAGIAIAIGAAAYLAIPGIAGAFLFSIGLYLVLWFNLNLYTGKVGYINTSKDIVNIFLIFIGNIIGCFAIMYLFPHPVAIELVATKLAQPFWTVCVKAIFCGILIYACVDAFKQGVKFSPLIAVPAFIIMGAEHSIADACFIIAAGAFTPTALAFIIFVALGNAVGSLLWRVIT